MYLTPIDFTSKNVIEKKSEISYLLAAKFQYTGNENNFLIGLIYVIFFRVYWAPPIGTSVLRIRKVKVMPILRFSW